MKNTDLFTPVNDRRMTATFGFWLAWKKRSAAYRGEQLHYDIFVRAEGPWCWLR